MIWFDIRSVVVRYIWEVEKSLALTGVFFDACFEVTHFSQA